MDGSERNQSEQKVEILNRQKIYPHSESLISFPQRYLDEPLSGLVDSFGFRCCGSGNQVCMDLCGSDQMKITEQGMIN